MARTKISHSKPHISSKEIRAVTAVLKSGFIAEGNETDKFEKQFLHTVKRKYAVAVNSGTSALHLALLALGVNQKSEVIIPSYVCTALLNTVNYTGAMPVIADVLPEDGNISVESVKGKISKRTKAIIVPHMFGKPANIKDVVALGIPVIEDCAQSLGAEYRGKMTGTFGNIAVFSFYATKVIASGEGGMVATDSRGIADKVRDLRSYDGREKYDVRYNYKMTDLSASLGKIQLSRLFSFISKRRSIASLYKKKIISPSLIHPSEDISGRHIYYRYVIELKKGNVLRVAGKFRKRNIYAERPVFKPLHRYLGLNKGDYPGAEECHKKFLSLPIYPSLTKAETQRIVKASLEIFGG